MVAAVNGCCCSASYLIAHCRLDILLDRLLVVCGAGPGESDGHCREAPSNARPRLPRAVDSRQVIDAAVVVFL